MIFTDTNASASTSFKSTAIVSPILPIDTNTVFFNSTKASPIVFVCGDILAAALATRDINSSTVKFIAIIFLVLSVPKAVSIAPLSSGAVFSSVRRDLLVNTPVAAIISKPFMTVVNWASPPPIFRTASPTESISLRVTSFVNPVASSLMAAFATASIPKPILLASSLNFANCTVPRPPILSSACLNSSVLTAA